MESTTTSSSNKSGPEKQQGKAPAMSMEWEKPWEMYKVRKSLDAAAEDRLREDAKTSKMQEERRRVEVSTKKDDKAQIMKNKAQIFSMMRKKNAEQVGTS